MLILYSNRAGLQCCASREIQTCKWNVYRAVRSPFKLVRRFRDHHDVGTLHDNFVRAVDTFRDYKYLEWLIVDHACSAYSYISVLLYDTLGPDDVKFIVNHADVQAIFCVPQTLVIVRL
ncbi:long-chain acyl-CoA synthetase 7 [Euphorbia peplus]|nr:long-chain acyl-CoA synthetase 7 [Euphorbia peplus]